MKILHLIYDHINNPWVGGGGAVRVHEICRRLAGCGHEITVLSGEYPGAKAYYEGNLEFYFAGTGMDNYILSTFSYAFSASRFVKKYGDRFDVIIEDFAPWNPVFSSLLTKRPVVLHINHLEGLNIIRRWSVLGMPFLLIERLYPRLFSRISALSGETRKKINSPDAVIVPAGIDSNLIVDSNHHRERNIDNDYILYIGRLHIKNKGLDTLLAAMNGLNTRLMVAGRGKDEKKLKEMAEKLELKNIVFSGFIREDEKFNLLRDGLIFVLPSRFEGWGIVVLEAAACGKPVIVSDIPELRYAVDAGFGISFKTGDASDLAAKIRFLNENRTLREEMGRKAREYVKNYTWDKIALDYERFLLDIVA